MIDDLGQALAIFGALFVLAFSLSVIIDKRGNK